MLPEETSYMSKRLLTLFRVKPRENTEAFLKIYHEFICGDTHYECLQNVLKIATA